MEDLFAAPILSKEFYERDAVTVARSLLGKVIVHEKSAGRIVETEAYLGTGDLAAHSARGCTPATNVIFGPPGFAYVYLIYGMHYCLNFVVEKDGIAGCVLIRALHPLAGLMPNCNCNGPGRLTKALSIGREQNGCDVTQGTLTVRDWNEVAFKIAISLRIGITKSVELPLRFNLVPP